VAGTLAVARPNAASGPGSRPHPGDPVVRLPRWDGATLLVLLVALNVLVPSAYAISALGGVATPANLVGLVALVWWFDVRLVGGLADAPGARPVRIALKLFAASVLLSYVAAAVRPLSGAEVTAADRGLLDMLTWVGIGLAAVDGIRDRRRLDTVLQAAVVAGAFVGLVGFLQFFTGFDPVRVLRAPGLSLFRVITSVDTRSSYRRVAGTAVHPIEFGVVMAATLPLAVHYALHARGLGRKVWRWTLAGLIGLALPLSLSRTAILGLAVVGLMLLSTWSWKRRVRALGVVLVLVNGLQFVVPGLFGTLRSLFTNLGGDPSIQGRTSDYSVAGSLIARNPIVGRGFRTFIPEKFILHSGKGGGTLILDNQYLGTLIETGVLGLLALLLVFAVPLLCARGARRRSTDPATRDLGQALAAAVTVGMLSFATFDGLSFPMATNLLFLLFGCCGALRRLDARTGPQ
jgi:hypothetical protein